MTEKQTGLFGRLYGGLAPQKLLFRYHLHYAEFSQLGPIRTGLIAGTPSGRGRIQELLGHSDLRTTVFYTDVASKNKPGIVSPLD